MCALDPWAAVEEVSDIIESLDNRITVGIPGNPRFEPLANAFVAGFKQPFSLEKPRRQVEITSLKREKLCSISVMQGWIGFVPRLTWLLHWKQEHRWQRSQVAGRRSKRF